MSIIKEIQVPDIGDFEDVDVIEILVSVGDKISKEDPLIALESDKATMEIPSPSEGVIKEILITTGSKVSQGTAIVKMEIQGDETDNAVSQPPATEAESKPVADTRPAVADSPESAKSKDIPRPSPAKAAVKPESSQTGLSHSSAGIDPSPLDLHAGPSVRKLSRELGVDLTKVVGSGQRGRITKEDVQAYVQKALQKKETKKEGFQLPSAPIVDFGKFGEIDIKPMQRIQKLSARNLHRNWITIPHVTQFDEADITDLEEFRKKRNDAAKEKDQKLSLMPFLYKAVVRGLQEYPVLNSSLDPDGENLVLKKYFHIGMAVDTKAGLLVPVIKDADQKDLQQLAIEMKEKIIKARDGKLKLDEMQGGCFTISSLGGIGGIGFTPIVNAPEVAILGVSSSAMRPVYQNHQFVPRLMLPLALSYDHRVVDGALAARYLSFVCSLLSDIRNML